VGVFFSFLIRWVLPLSAIIIIERFTNGITQLLSVIGVLAVFLTYLWFTTHPIGSNDDDPGGNDNVNRKFHDYM
jgi:hypothetical protein